MTRALILFILSALLSIGTFYLKSEHRFDVQLVVPVGLYFIIAFLLAIQPSVETQKKLQFAGLALLVWIVLFLASYNVLFVFIAPVAGGLGAWLIILLSRKFLDLTAENIWPVVWTGVVMALIGIGFMALVKKQVSIGLKAGILTGLWQLGVGWYLVKSMSRPPKNQGITQEEAS